MLEIHLNLIRYLDITNPAVFCAKSAEFLTNKVHDTLNTFSKEVDSKVSRLLVVYGFGNICLFHASAFKIRV